MHDHARVKGRGGGVKLTGGLERYAHHDLVRRAGEFVEGGWVRYVARVTWASPRDEEC